MRRRPVPLKRATDVVVAVVVGGVLMPLALIVAALVRATSRGPVLFWSRRIGYLGQPFAMPKFRTMAIDTPDLPSDALPDPASWLTPVGAFLRRTSLDEIPQLWCVLRGDMSLVGPRPALFNQYELIASRRENGVDRLVPGVTGWAQINGRDTIEELDKVAFDVAYLARRSWWFDLTILFRTVPVVLGARDISH